MRLTNKLSLPEPIVEAIRNDGYSKGDSDITATSLLEPPRIGALKLRYADELEEDVADRLYSIQGQSIHTILERAAIKLREQGYLCLPEERFHIMVPMLDNTTWKISAQIDVLHIESGTLQDYKVTSVYAVKDGPKEEYVKQMNIQAHILRKNGHKVERLQIVAILRDWSKLEYARELKDAQPRGFASPLYPAHQVKILDVPMIPEEEVELYITERAIEHQKARALPDDQLPVCSSEERWERKGKYAIMKPGLKKASKLFDTEEEAKVSLAQFGAGAKVEARPGESIRCASYCAVSSKCEVAKKNGWTK